MCLKPFDDAGKLDGYAIMREAYKSGPEAVAGIMLTSDRLERVG